MSLIRTLNFDNTIVEVFDDYVPKEKKQNLKKMYDVINEIAQDLEPKVIKNWFLKPTEIEEMKKTGKYIFL